VGRAEHANGNFGAIGNENLGNGQNGLLRRSDAGMLHPRRKFLTSCHRNFNLSCDCEMQFFDMLKQFQEKCDAVSVRSCVKIKCKAVSLR
ncbi:hypothetical protein, partial [Rhizobium sp. PEPV16]|uniref:hypothetical protein n=1 Tax=Rhizobium sp. PEPV16 TaxID=1820614 RepID=UPI001AEF6369